MSTAIYHAKHHHWCDFCHRQIVEDDDYFRSYQGALVNTRFICMECGLLMLDRVMKESESAMKEGEQDGKTDI